MKELQKKNYQPLTRTQNTFQTLFKQQHNSLTHLGVQYYGPHTCLNQLRKDVRVA